MKTLTISDDSYDILRSEADFGESPDEALSRLIFRALGTPPHEPECKKDKSFYVEMDDLLTEGPPHEEEPDFDRFDAIDPLDKSHGRKLRFWRNITLMSVYALGGEARVKDVMRYIQENWGYLFDAREWEIKRQLGKSVELRWQNNVAWARERCKTYGFILPPESSAKGIWSLTERGTELAEQLVEALPSKLPTATFSRT